MIRSRPVAVVATATLLLVGAACGGDDEDPSADATTSTSTAADGGDDEDPSTTTEDATTTTEDVSTTTAGEDQPTTTSDDDAPTTTSPNLPPNDSPLAELLADPTELGEGYVPDDSLGDGSFDGDLCEDVFIEAAWEEQASQALRQGTGDDAVTFQQTILRFFDESAAEAFCAQVSDGLVTCQPGTTMTEVAGVGDEAVLAALVEEGSAVAGGLVRSGDLVGYSSAIGPAEPGLPVDEAHLAAFADRLAG